MKGRTNDSSALVFESSVILWHCPTAESLLRGRVCPFDQWVWGQSAITLPQLCAVVLAVSFPHTVGE